MLRWLDLLLIRLAGGEDDGLVCCCAGFVAVLVCCWAGFAAGLNCWRERSWVGRLGDQIGFGDHVDCSLRGRVDSSVWLACVVGLHGSSSARLTDLLISFLLSERVRLLLHARPFVPRDNVLAAFEVVIPFNQNIPFL